MLRVDQVTHRAIASLQRRHNLRTGEASERHARSALHRRLSHPFSQINKLECVSRHRLTEAAQVTADRAASQPKFFSGDLLCIVHLAIAAPDALWRAFDVDTAQVA